MVEAAGVEPEVHLKYWAFTTTWEKNGSFRSQQKVIADF